ncbi:unnamed protein product [Effrenium voratum]|nr:unnamed protein product [Effrenium voratum]
MSRKPPTRVRGLCLAVGVSLVSRTQAQACAGPLEETWKAALSLAGSAEPLRLGQELAWSEWSRAWLPLAQQVVQDLEGSLAECPEGSVAAWAHGLLALDEVQGRATVLQTIKMMHHTLSDQTPPDAALQPSQWQQHWLLAVSSLIRFLYLKWVNIPQDNDLPDEVAQGPRFSPGLLRRHQEFLFRTWEKRQGIESARLVLNKGAVSPCHVLTCPPCENLMATVAVVGGGMAGVAAARVLGRAGLQVRLYEREQLGGRLGALQLGEHQVGLGATYVKAKDPLFKAEMAKWEEMGLASEWSVGVPHFIEGPGDFREKPELKGPDDRWHVGRPNMASFVQLSEEDRKQITICGEVSSLRWAEDSWVLNSEDVVAGLILALPVAQLKPLLPAGSEDLLPKELLDKDFEKGRVAAGFVFPERLRLPFRLAFVKDSPISMVLNDSSRLQTGKACWWHFLFGTYRIWSFLCC